MKKKDVLLTIFLCFFLFKLFHAQGSISNITISPLIPTIDDTITVYADLTFSNGSCELDYSSHSVVNNNVYANTHHCLGMLMVICSITDTFKLDPLPAGLYNFDLILNSGFGGPPCTPGIVADDNAAIQFEVIDPSGLSDYLSDGHYFHPNPSKRVFNFETLNHYDKVIVYSTKGQEILSQPVLGYKGAVSLDVEPGVYFVRFKTLNGLFSSMKKILVIQ